MLSASSYITSIFLIYLRLHWVFLAVPEPL